MTIHDVAAQYNVCDGRWHHCPWRGTKRHMAGFIDVFGTAHYTDRRFTRRSLRNLLLLIARRDRMADPGWLNDDKLFAYYYLYVDEVAASKMAKELGFRLPAKLSRLSRLRCQALARKAGVRLSKRSALYAWANDV